MEQNLSLPQLPQMSKLEGLFIDLLNEIHILDEFISKHRLESVLDQTTGQIKYIERSFFTIEDIIQKDYAEILLLCEGAKSFARKTYKKFEKMGNLLANERLSVRNTYHFVSNITNIMSEVGALPEEDEEEVEKVKGKKYAAKALIKLYHLLIFYRQNAFLVEALMDLLVSKQKLTIKKYLHTLKNFQLAPIPAKANIQTKEKEREDYKIVDQDELSLFVKEKQLPAAINILLQHSLAEIYRNMIKYADHDQDKSIILYHKEDEQTEEHTFIIHVENFVNSNSEGSGGKTGLNLIKDNGEKVGKHLENGTVIVEIENNSAKENGNKFVVDYTFKINLSATKQV